MDGSRRKDPRRGSVSMVAEMVFKSFSTASRAPDLLAAEKRAAAYLPWKMFSIIQAQNDLKSELYLDAIDWDRSLDNSVPGHTSAEAAGEDREVSSSHLLL